METFAKKLFSSPWRFLRVAYGEEAAGILDFDTDPIFSRFGLKLNY